VSERYRICPHGPRSWKVQRFNWPFWLNCKRHTGYGAYVRTFDSEAEAEDWIRDRLKQDEELDSEIVLTRNRRRDHPPREFHPTK
jgi:hypothetical protein